MSVIIIPPPQNVGGGYTGFALLRRSVGRSVGPSPILIRSITPLLIEGFPSNLNDTFTSTRGCAEPMLPMCQVKVKVTVKGQIFNKQYYTLCRVRSIISLIVQKSDVTIIHNKSVIDLLCITYGEQMQYALSQSAITCELQR